jgi:outer membrane protein
VRSTIVRWLTVAWIATIAPAARALAQEPSIAPGGTLTLDRAIAIALVRHPARMAAQAEAGAADERAGEARSALLPHVAGIAEYLRGTDNGIGDTSYVPAIGINRAPTTGRHVDQLSDTFDNYVAGISAFQYLFDFGRTRGRIAERDAQADAQSARLELVKLDLAYDVARAFFDVLAAKQKLRVYEAAVKKRTEHLHEAQVKASAGLRADIDAVSADAELARAKLALVDARNQAQTAKTELDAAMGLGEEAPDYRVAAPPPDASVARPIEESIASALRHRPDLAMLLDEARAAGAQVAQVRSDYWPRFGAVAGFNTRGQDGDPASNYYAGLVVSWPIFDGFATDHEVAEGKLHQDAIGHSIDDLRQRIVVQVKRAWLDRQAAVDRVARSEKAVDATRLQLDLADRRYANGLGSIIELTDAERQETEAEADLIRARVEQSLARAALDRATGLGVPVAGEGATFSN